MAKFTGIRPFKAEDMIKIAEVGIKEYGLKIKTNGQMKELAESREANGQCLTGVTNDVIVGCGGIDLMWTGVGEVWLIMSYEVDKYPLRAYEIIRDGLAKLIEGNDLFRVQGWCRVDFAQAHSLFKHLGFKAEGIAKKYTPDGADCILYAKVKNG